MIFNNDDYGHLLIAIEPERIHGQCLMIQRRTRPNVIFEGTEIKPCVTIWHWRYRVNVRKDLKRSADKLVVIATAFRHAGDG